MPKKACREIIGGAVNAGVYFFCGLHSKWLKDQDSDYNSVSVSTNLGTVYKELA